MPKYFKFTNIIQELKLNLLMMIILMKSFLFIFNKNLFQFMLEFFFLNHTKK